MKIIYIAIIVFMCTCNSATTRIKKNTNTKIHVYESDSVCFIIPDSLPIKKNNSSEYKINFDDKSYMIINGGLLKLEDLDNLRAGSDILRKDTIQKYSCDLIKYSNENYNLVCLDTSRTLDSDFFNQRISIQFSGVNLYSSNQQRLYLNIVDAFFNQKNTIK